MAGMGGATSAGRRGGVRGGRLVRGGVAGLALALGVASGAAAQEPSASAGPAPGPMFVQEFQSGTLVPAPQGAGVTITLEGDTGLTALVRGGPDPRVAVVQTSNILTSIAGAVNDPPDAAIVSQLADGSQVTYLVMLLGAQQQPNAQLVYDAWLLDAGDTGGLQLEASPAPPPTGPVTLGLTHVFIYGLGDPCMRCTP